MTEPTIICPNCRTEIKLTESLAAPLIEPTRQFEAQLAQKDADVAKRELAMREKEKQLALILKGHACQRDVQGLDHHSRARRVCVYVRVRVGCSRLFPGQEFREHAPGDIQQHASNEQLERLRIGQGVSDI